MDLSHSLFLKIFLWFGSAMLTVIAITFIVGGLVRIEPIRLHVHDTPNLVLHAYANTAVDTYERQGSDALVAYVDQLERTTRLQGFLFSADLREVSGRSAPSTVLDAARQVAQTNDPKIIKDRAPQLLVDRIQNARGEQYFWVVQMPAHPTFVFEHVLLLGAMMVTGAIFCYWLAWYLTAPLKKLRSATNELARGNLGTRVAPSLGRRRDELVSLGADFDAMAEQIESLLKAQRRLLGDISHELRSPLARLIVALELARQRAGPAATTALERIEHEAANLNEMIGQLLALTRVESGTRESSKVAVNLTKLVQSIADDADFEARSCKRSVRFRPSENYVMAGSEELLRPAIENVVRNAVQYTAEDTEVEIEIRSNASRSNLTNGDGAGPQRYAEPAFAEITVRDHGTGVPESELVEIFRPFYRVDDARDRESGGTGLGLAITERAINLHGGTVRALNAPDGGLIIRINLPLTESG